MKQSRQLRLIVKDLGWESWPEFPVKRLMIRREMQKTLFGEDYKRRAHILMGLFYEMLSSVLYGGKLSDSFFLEDREDRGGNGLSGMIKPDVTVMEDRILIESKAVRSGHQFNILDEQIERYKVYQSMSPEFKIYYTVWRHSLRNIKSYNKDQEALFRDLCSNTICCLIFPLRVILGMHESDSFKRYETDKWDHCTRINSGFLNMVLIEDLCGQFFNHVDLDQHEFRIKEFRLPDGISVCGFDVEPFPVVVVKDMNYEEWAMQYAEDFVPF